MPPQWRLPTEAMAGPQQAFPWSLQPWTLCRERCCPFMAQAARGQGDVDGIAFSWLSSSMAAAAETSQVDADLHVFLIIERVGQISPVHRCELYLL